MLDIDCKEKKRFCERFGAPEAAVPVIDAIVTPQEQALALAIEREPFTEAAVAALAPESGNCASLAYQRGVFSRVDEGDEGNVGAPLYRVANFYTRLDVFVLTELETYRSFGKETRRALDEWYFEAYYKGLVIERGVLPTQDVVLTRAEAFAYIENEERQVYLTNCDCRALSGDCGKPSLTCLSYRNGVNSSAHRGISKPVSKERAKEVVLDADKAGLMHTANAHTICNCCADCCYLSRARRRRNEETGLNGQADAALAWPSQSKTVSFQGSLCSNCGLCITRCPFGLFKRNKEGCLSYLSQEKGDSSRCVGCGLCVNTCPSGALTLRSN